MMERLEDSSNFPVLAPDSARAIDQLIESGEIRPVESADDAQVGAAAGLAALLDEYPIEDSTTEQQNSLLNRTLTRIREHQYAAKDTFRSMPSLRFGPGPDDSIDYRPRALTINWRDALSIAAVILLMISVTVPMLDAARNAARRQACCSNMAGSAVAFGQYADDHNNAMPAVYGEPPNGNWLESRANSANLFALAKQGYVSLATLACPSNSNAGVSDDLLEGTNWPSRVSSSYAYQNQFGAERPQWGQRAERLAVLSDRNPHVDASCPDVAGVPQGPGAMSPCHQYSRQNILINDGTVVQAAGPYFGDDNIFLPANMSGIDSRNVQFVGTEIPTSVVDAMLIQ